MSPGTTSPSWNTTEAGKLTESGVGNADVLAVGVRDGVPGAVPDGVPGGVPDGVLEADAPTGLLEAAGGELEGNTTAIQGGKARG